MFSSLLSLFPRRGSGWPPATKLAFVGLVLIAYLGSMWEGSLRWSRPRDCVCLGLGAAFCVAGMVDLEVLIHHRSVWARRLYIGLLTVLLFAILWTSRLNGEVSFCVYPVIAVCLALLTPVPAAAAVFGLYAMTLAVEARFWGVHGLERWAYSLIPGFVFVIVFTQMAIGAIRAKHRSEALAAEIERLTVIQERNRLAREIHDSLGHFLTTIHVQLQAAQAVHPADPSRALEAVAKAQALARDALVEVRRSVSTLQADVVLPPLPGRLRELAVATDGWGAAVSLEVLGTVRTLSPNDSDCCSSTTRRCSERGCG